MVMGREKVFLICSECLARNYTLTKRKDSSTRLSLNKYCPHCGRHTLHKESK
jgi:large subunit ribosomal protein L33